MTANQTRWMRVQVRHFEFLRGFIPFEQGPETVIAVSRFNPALSCFNLIGGSSDYKPTGADCPVWLANKRVERTESKTQPKSRYPRKWQSLQ